VAQLTISDQHQWAEGCRVIVKCSPWGTRRLSHTSLRRAAIQGLEGVPRLRDDERQQSIRLVGRGPIQTRARPSINSPLTVLPPTTVGRINSLRVGLTDVPDQQYPASWLLSQPMDRTATGNDVARAEVTLSTNSVEVWKDLSLPKNV
jgi:hypothetical protein